MSYFGCQCFSNDSVWKRLTSTSVIELTVGVMCSCFPSFAGFVRHHLPLLRSIASLFTSIVHSLRHSRLFRGQTSRDSSMKLGTKDIQLTLGSKVDGQGRFMTSTGSPGNRNSSIEQTENDQFTPEPKANSAATRRDYLEGAAEAQHHPNLASSTRWSRAVDTHSPLPNPGLTALPLFPDIEQGTSRPTTWWPHWRSREPTVGYWNTLSFFRSDNASRSSGRSKTTTLSV